MDSETPRFDAFLIYHRANPNVYRLFKKFALQAFLHGVKKLGARLICERIRWYSMIEINKTDRFKISNNHVPYYARLLMGTDHRFVDFFSIKDSRLDVDVQTLVQEVYADESD